MDLHATHGIQLDEHTNLYTFRSDLTIDPASTNLDDYRLYRGLHLDRFQQAACWAVDRDFSVIVSAPTGSGKTVVADFLIEKAYREGKTVYYTAPIKALSMQKFREFKSFMGDNVGILTGDIVINPDAPVCIMTTEVLHNMLLEGDLRTELNYVIFDEIHYLGDRDRGHVWEQCLILLPQKVKILGLSATIPNLREFAGWLSTVRSMPMMAIRHTHRPVPLSHYVYETRTGLVPLSKFPDRLAKANEPDEGLDFDWDHGDFPKSTNPKTRVLDLVVDLEDEDLPALVFVFSRRQCENLALEAAEARDYLSWDQKKEVHDAISDVKQYVKGSAGLSHLAETLPHGIAFHHAGLLPRLKTLVEELFERGLVKLNFATETWALGINMPVRTACFAAPTKFDGQRFRPLKEHEYFQMAGRAGRRGIDPYGKSIIVFDASFHDLRDLPSGDEDKMEPLRSSFNLTYNTVLNLAARYSDDEVLDLFSRSFGVYHDRKQAEYLDKEIRSLKKRIKSMSRQFDFSRKGRKNHKKEFRRFRRLSRREKRLRKQLKDLDRPEVRFKTYNRKRRLLEDKGYIEDGKLLYRGKIMQYLHVQELLVTELIASGILFDLTPEQLAALAVSIDYEPRRGERTPRPFFRDKRIYRVLERVIEWEKQYLGETEVLYHESLADAADAWAKGAAFATILNMTGADEGSIVSQFRRAIDILRQIEKSARGMQPLREKAREAIGKLDRDVVSVYL